MNTGKLSRLTGRDAVILDRDSLTLQYPREVVTREVLKSGVGLAFCLGVVIFLEPANVIAWILYGISALFAFYLYEQSKRFRVNYLLDDSGVKRQNAGRDLTIRWSELDNVKLNYYAHGRKSNNGTLVLSLFKGKQKLKVDSNLDHFPTLLFHAASRARERDLFLNPTTAENFTQLEL